MENESSKVPKKKPVVSKVKKETKYLSSLSSISENISQITLVPFMNTVNGYTIGLPLSILIPLDNLAKNWERFNLSHIIPYGAGSLLFYFLPEKKDFLYWQMIKEKMISHFKENDEDTIIMFVKNRELKRALYFFEGKVLKIKKGDYIFKNLSKDIINFVS